MKKILAVLAVTLALVGCGSEKAAPTVTVDHAGIFQSAIDAKDGKAAYNAAKNAGICAQGLALVETMENEINSDDYVTTLGNLSAMCGLY